MVARTIDGRAVAAVVRDEVRERVRRLAERGVVPGLATVLVGDDRPSATYVASKTRACLDVGIRAFGHRLAAGVSQDEVVALVRRLGSHPEVHGILVQLPLPAGIDSATVLAAIPPLKDVDGLHPENQGRLLAGLPGLRPCTPLGVLRLLDAIGCELRGVQATVVGRSVLVGKPLALLLLERHATVTICHSHTRGLAGEVERAEVLVAAIGREGSIRGEWIRRGAVVIDVGINRTAEGHLVGDVEFEAAAQRASWITPVPGGVGPMTVAMLLANTVAAAEGAVDGGAP